MKCPTVLLITMVSVLLASGILMIIVPSIIVNNYWSLLSIFIFATSLIFPFLCNACAISSNTIESFLFDDGGQAELGGMLSWLLTGALITIGYAIPFELWRVNRMQLVEFILTACGGTVILVAILTFQFVLMKRGE